MNTCKLLASIFVFLLLNSCSFYSGGYPPDPRSNEAYGYIMSDASGNVYSSLNRSAVTQYANLGPRRVNSSRYAYCYIPREINSIIVETYAGKNIFGDSIKNRTYRNRIETGILEAGIRVAEPSAQEWAEWQNMLEAYGSGKRIPVSGPLVADGILHITVTYPRTEFRTYGLTHYSMQLHAEVISRRAEKIWSKDLIMDAVLNPRLFPGEHRVRIEEDIVNSFSRCLRRASNGPGMSSQYQVSN